MLETAKVDIRKLQHLNDRINECFDALAQVRGSVHGLSHSSPSGAWPQQAVHYGVQDLRFGQQDPQLYGQPTGTGLSHSSYGHPVAYGNQQPVGFAPRQAYGEQGIGYGQGFQRIPISGGLSHSPADIGVQGMIPDDPALAMRIAQTFPFARQPAPPVTQIP